MISLPIKPKVIEKKDNKATFVVEALCPGYGVTVGNSLRRVFLSSMPGAAITQMKIKGAQHEFSTMPGVLEDVVLIILNLKKLRFKMHSAEPQKASLKVKGEKQVTAGDFELPSQVELINKTAPIATITDKKTTLEMEVQIENGMGYEPTERRKKEKSEIGVIPLDAIFSPVKRVSFRVENMRVGERTDFDRLFFEVETDGTITPEEAFKQSSEILVNHFSLFRDTFREEEKPAKVPAKKSASAPAPAKATEGTKATEDKPSGAKKEEEDVAKVAIEDLKLSGRTVKSLLKNNIKTVGGILKKSQEKLLGLEGMGETGVGEVKKALKKLGVELK